MHSPTIALLAVASCYLLLPCVAAVLDSLPSQDEDRLSDSLVNNEMENVDNSGATLHREKRTLFLKKKLIGAGLLGFGLGVAKGYKAGYHTAPQVRHVYLSAPPPPPASVRYVEYVEKPVFVERIIERPAPILKDSSPYGAW